MNRALLLCSLLLVGSCNGQAATAPPARAVDQDTPIAQYVVAAFADSNGVLWFGALGKGVARYDGELTYLDTAADQDGNVVTSIVEDADGNLWFAGHEGTGLCKYDGTTLTRYWTEETRVGMDRSKTVWASTNHRVYRYDGTSFTEFDIPLGAERPAIYSIVSGRVTFQLEDSRGNLWFSTDGLGAIRYDGSSFTQFTKQDGLCSNTVWSILEDRQGRIWFSCIQAFQPEMTGDGGLSRYDGETFTSFPDVAGLRANDIYTIYEDRKGNIWIGATGLGAYRFDGKDFTLFEETNRPDLTTNFGLQAMVEDRHGTLWCGFSGGLFRFDGESFIHVGQHGAWN